MAQEKLNKNTAEKTLENITSYMRDKLDTCITTGTKII
jgi:hypothetical protein